MVEMARKRVRARLGSKDQPAQFDATHETLTRARGKEKEGIAPSRRISSARSLASADVLGLWRVACPNGNGEAKRDAKRQECVMTGVAGEASKEGQGRISLLLTLQSEHVVKRPCGEKFEDGEVGNSQKGWGYEMRDSFERLRRLDV